MNKDLLIDKSKKIEEAMNKLGKANPKILFVVDRNKLVGTLTDGDVRRYLLAKGKIEDLVCKACNANPIVASSFSDAKEKYSENYFAIPIVKNSKLVDIYVGENIKEEINKINVPVVINAGGIGSRLEPFTKVLPKPLIPVGDLPIIEHIINRFEKFGCKKFFTIVNYKKQLIKAYFNESENKHNISCVDEEKPLGTIGGLSLLKGKIKGNFFFVNCDTLLVSDYSKILGFHKENNADITLVCADKNINIPFGVVKTNKNKEFKAMEEKPNLSFITNIGFYVLNEKTLKDIPQNKRLDMPEFIENEKKKGRKVFVYIVPENEWLDVGQLPELEKTRKALFN